jgi:hypothetical protein
MRIPTLVILCAFVAQACAQAEESMDRLAGNVQDSMDKFGDKIFNKLVDDLFDRAVEPPAVRHGDLDKATLGKSGHLAMPTQLSSRPLLPQRGPSAAAAARAFAPPRWPQSLRRQATSPGLNRAPFRSLRDMAMRAVEEESKSEIKGDVSDAKALKERLDSLDALLGPTTTLSTAEPSYKRMSTEAPSFKIPELPKDPAKAAKKMTSGAKETAIDFGTNSINAYQAVLSVRFVLDWLTLLGLDARQPPWGGFRLLTDPYLNLFAILGPFSFIAGFYILSFLRDYLNSQR